MRDRYNIIPDHFFKFQKISDEKRSQMMQFRLQPVSEMILDLMKIGIELIDSETNQIAILTTHAFFALSARVRLSGCVIVKYRSTAIVPSANIELKVD